MLFHYAVSIPQLVTNLQQLLPMQLSYLGNKNGNRAHSLPDITAISLPELTSLQQAQLSLTLQLSRCTSADLLHFARKLSLVEGYALIGMLYSHDCAFIVEAISGSVLGSPSAQLLGNVLLSVELFT